MRFAILALVLLSASCMQPIEIVERTYYIEVPVPVAPEPEPTPQGPERIESPYSLYVIDRLGGIVAEDHCLDIGDYPSRDAYFSARRRAFQLYVQTAVGPLCPYHLIEGYLYIPEVA